MSEDLPDPTTVQPSHVGPPSFSDEEQVANQTVQQNGKYAVNLRQGQEVHIGDRIFYQTDVPAIRQIVREELQIHHKEYGEPIKTGLIALIGLMQLPDVHSAVATFRVNFQEACKQIDKVADLKALHDQLHTLDQCYRSIVKDKDLKTFPENETISESLVGYHLNLQIVIDDVREIANRQVIGISKLAWLNQLEQAQSELQQAIECSNVECLQRAIDLLERVLAIQPSRINTHLNAAANALRLPELIRAITTIWEQLSSSNLDLQKLSQFKQAVDAIADLDNRLTALIVAHDYLQEMDLDLRRIETNLNVDLTELEFSWLDLKNKTEMLFDSQTDDWALAFNQDCQNLNAALLEKNPARIKQCFWSYQRRARHSFYKVDVTLKGLCDELRKVGEPLTSVLRMLE